MIVGFGSHVLRRESENPEFIDCSAILADFSLPRHSLSHTGAGNPSFTPSIPWKMFGIVIFLTLDGVRRRRTPSQGRSTRKPSSLPPPTPQSGNYRRQRARVRDYDKSMIARPENLLRAWREWDSAPAAIRINAKDVIRRRGATIGGGDRGQRKTGLLANPSSLHGNKNIWEKHREKWLSFYGCICDTAIQLSSFALCNETAALLRVKFTS